MKKSIKISLIFFIIIIVLVVGIIFLFSNVKITLSLNNQNSTVQGYTDEDILSFLKERNIINSDDIYVTYDRDIGNWGPEGNKRYIYKRNNESYYYIEISTLSYTKDGEYSGYKYKANEVFYKLYIQNCDYNKESQFMDERILEKLGDISYYIVSEQNNSLKLTSITS